MKQLLRGYGKGNYLEYSTRFCPYCSRAIPKFSRLTGERLRKSKYQQLKTCGDTTCKGDSMNNSHPQHVRFKPAQDQPIDKFIYGL